MNDFTMIVKLLDPVRVYVNITYKRHSSHLLKSCRYLNKRRFCSKNDENDTSQNLNVKKLLESSSPLKSSDRFDDTWATSPYPEGTTFQDSAPNTEYDEMDSKLDWNTSSSVILFPGQGNQFVGMAKNLVKYPVAMDMFKSAYDVLGYDLLKICLEGPEDVLNDTKYCQPATFVCSLALLEKVKAEKPWAISNCRATCGYSLGELTALVFAGSLDFEKGLRLVKKRAEAMEKCCKNIPGGMLTVLIGPKCKLSSALSDAIEHCKSDGIENPQCAVASYLFPNCKVIAGNIKALEFIKKNAKTYDIRRHSLLPVSGAFHTLLMKDAAETLKKELQNLILKRPIVTVFSNVTGKPYLNPMQIKNILPKQIYKPIKWEQIMHSVLSGPANEPQPYLYECGPGSSLSTVAKKVRQTSASQIISIEL